MAQSRRSFVRCLASVSAAQFACTGNSIQPTGMLAAASPNDAGIFEYLSRDGAPFSREQYCRLLGAANEFKEGDEILGVAASSNPARLQARQLLLATRLEEIDAHSPYEDQVSILIRESIDQKMRETTRRWRFAELKSFLLSGNIEAVNQILPGLSSDVIGCVVKLMTNDELVRLGGRIFHTLPGSNIGAKGYLGARIQPNSPTDNLDDIRWQVFNGWAFAVGDVLLGTNPVSSEPESVAAVERALQQILHTFQLQDTIPHCVLAHIDVQAQAEKLQPGCTELWFQSIAGCESANQTFDISVDSMLQHAAHRTGRFGLYFETGQGADFTNGHGHGFDMVLHESRKYGFARALTQRVSDARVAHGADAMAWVHLNDVAGFIGPEVFRTREQLVRCCLEDIVMGKLHGLCIGLDVCSTLHMDVSLDDLDWCLDRIVPAQPAYLMALPTKIDPMLGYLTTGFHDHVRLREKFGTRVEDRMWKFFQRLQIVDDAGQPTEHFGDPLWVYLQYCRAQGDARLDAQIVAEGREQMREVRSRGVFLTEGYGKHRGELSVGIRNRVNEIYRDARKSIHAELPENFAEAIPAALAVSTLSRDRTDYILHPESGEKLSPDSIRSLTRLREELNETADVQLMISDGLNALAISDLQQLQPFLDSLAAELDRRRFRCAKRPLLTTSGRVRAGYQAGETVFGGMPGRRALLHIIGERPGTGHRTFSVYLTAATGTDWGVAGRIDHDQTRVVAGIANTALRPEQAAGEVARILQRVWEELPDD